jgi:spermidine/putrescine transport system permease protein
MKNTSKFQNVVIATIVGWLVLFVFLPNLMIIATSFLTRDDANFVKLVFTLDNYARLLDPLYYDVLLHSLNMALLATLACLALGYPFAWFLAGCRKSAPAAAVSADRAVLDQLVDPYLRAEDLPQHQRVSQRVSAVAGVIDTPLRIMFTPRR